MEQRRRIDRVADPDFTEGLADLPMDELRARRAMCDELDTELSYYRRILHGRMDLLAFELRRRTGEETRSLIEALPEILADAEASAPPPKGEGLPRELPIEAPQFAGEGRRTIDRALGDDFLAHLPTLDAGELENVQGLLAETEREISKQRRKVYEAYEQLTAEITRRYREGLADPAALLDRS